jgi:hypothetical protein
VVHSIEERVFIVEYVFREGNRYTDLVQEQFAEKIPRNTLYLIPDQNLFVNKIKRVQACIDDRKHHFQRHL